MTRLSEGQFELDGYVFGEGTRVRLLQNGWDTGSGEFGTQDVVGTSRDGRMLGRDYIDGPEWTLTMVVHDGQDVYPTLQELANVWRADAVRSTPGALSVLRYRWRGVTYRVLGRPRNFGLTPQLMRDDQRRSLVATFRLASPEQYIEPADDDTRRLELHLIEPPSAGGIVLPALLPWSLRPDSQARNGEVTVGGHLPAPFKVTVHGPVTGVLSGISLSGQGWQVTTSASLKYDQTLVVDTRSATILRDGVSVAGTLTRKSRLTARLAVGHQSVTFSGVDPTNTAYAVFEWLDTIPA